MINFGNETEKMEFKKTTGELHDAVIDMTAILNKHESGTVYFGVMPNGDVKGFQVVESTLRDISRVVFESIKPQIYPQIEKITIDGRDIVEVKFDGKDRPYSAYGKYYIRVADESREMTPAELKSMMLEGELATQWEMRETECSLDDIDEEALKTFYERATAYGRLPQEPFHAENLLGKLGLIRNGKLNNAGRVLFGKTGAVVLKLAVFASDEKLTFLDINREENNIFRLVDEAENYIKRNIRWRAEINGLRREEIPEIPLNALREIIINSFAHAQYGTSSQHEIDIHPGKIVIYNPGEFPSRFSPEDFATQNLSSILRNELIAKTLYLCHDIESFGSGFRRVYTSCAEANVKCAYNKLPYGFSFVFFRNNSGEQSRIVVDYSHEPDFLTSNESKVYEFLKEQPNLTKEELASKIDKTPRTVQRVLNSLKKKQKIIRVGTSQKGYWQVQ